MVFKEELRKRTEAAEAILESYLPIPTEHTRTLAEAIRYSCMAGGKRIRPILMLESYALFGGKGEVIRPFAAAIEMIHTHSLIHDDLPAIDNDDYRRGRLTTHVVYGEAVAVLAGDALLNYAYETALTAFVAADDPAEASCGTDHAAADRGCGDAGSKGDTASRRIAAACAILAAKSGIHGMLGGQGLDVQNEKNDVFALDEETLSFIYENKTAALLEAPLMIGAILAGADDRTVSTMEEVGRKIGLAFQIRDDILDVTSTTEELGKPVCSDEKNNKTTYVTLMGTEKAEAYVRQLTEEAIALVEAMPGDSTFLIELLRSLAERRK
ncbi:MAG: polyprenyl synthetase family protein [Eubacterium sp.]|nr:polyprenyl synthetase family protein [Eubacterium sp.]